jgi:hypothetical protein
MEPRPTLATSHDEFHNHHNIRVGRGRILFAATPTTDSSGRYHPPGWVLPGGRRTQDREIALAAAHRIDQLSQ